jgi:hypothetical protein
MASEATTQDSTTAKKTDDTNAATAQATTDAVSRTEFLELRNSLNRLIRLSSEKKERQETAATKDTTESPDNSKDKTEAQKLADELKALRNGMAERDKRQKEASDKIARNAKQAAVRSAFESIVGLKDEPDGIPHLTERMKLFMLDNKDNISFDEDSETVMFKPNAIDEPMPLSDWFVRSEKEGQFKHLKPKKNAPKAEPRRGEFQAPDQTGRIKMTRAEYKAAMIDGVQGLDKVDLTD